MRSENADLFNHDSQADRYDRSVQNEADPIRTGYSAVLDWVIEQATIDSESTVLDLGSGTGNLSARIPECRRLVCVDISRKMTEAARPKLAHLPEVSFVQEDLLRYFDTPGPFFTAVISTYTVHHLTEKEKQLLFRLVWNRLAPGGRAVFGDLMLKDANALPEAVRHYRAKGMDWVAESFEEEFYWYVDQATAALEQTGFTVEARQFSDLSWGLAALKPEG